MKYIFRPFEFNIDKKARPKANFWLNISTYNYCNNSHGLFISIRVIMFKSFTICIIPFGELKINE